MLCMRSTHPMTKRCNRRHTAACCSVASPATPDIECRQKLGPAQCCGALFESRRRSVRCSRSMATTRRRHSSMHTDAPRSVVTRQERGRTCHRQPHALAPLGAEAGSLCRTKLYTPSRLKSYRQHNRLDKGRCCTRASAATQGNCSRHAQHDDRQCGLDSACPCRRLLCKHSMLSIPKPCSLRDTYPRCKPGLAPAAGTISRRPVHETRQHASGTVCRRHTCASTRSSLSRPSRHNSRGKRACCTPPLR